MVGGTVGDVPRARSLAIVAAVRVPRGAVVGCAPLVLACRNSRRASPVLDVSEGSRTS